MKTKPHDHARFTNGHRFLSHDHGKAQTRAVLVTGLTAVFMVVEIVAGLWFGSMALLADGVHMLTHAGALGMAALAYVLARRYNGGGYFSFGSGKFGDLSAFASAIVLGMLALMVAAQSAMRMASPVPVAFGEALFVAAIGLLVNIVSAVLLHDDHHDHNDNNLRAAYVHVLTDALTSVLAILALAAGLFFGFFWADAVAGLVGAAMIGIWSFTLLCDSGKVLLDVEDNPGLADDIKAWVEDNYPVAICDFHLWRLGPGHRGLILSLVGGQTADSETLKQKLSERYPSLSHITVEMEVCTRCAPPSSGIRRRS
jgi:cation diffusion facilitator family transporter